MAEPAKEYDKDTSTKSQPQQDQLVGVVDVTVLRDNDVLQHLDGAEEYLYVSGIAVSNDFRFLSSAHPCLLWKIVRVFLNLVQPLSDFTMKLVDDVLSKSIFSITPALGKYSLRSQIRSYLTSTVVNALL